MDQCLGTSGEEEILTKVWLTTILFHLISVDKTVQLIIYEGKKFGESVSDFVIGKHGGFLESYLSLVGKDTSI